MIKPIKAICDPNSIVMNLISNWGDAIIIQHLCTILLPSSGRWFSSTVVLDLVDENGRVSYTCLPCLYYCQMINSCKCSVYFFPGSIILQWQSVETNSSFPVFFINTVCLCLAVNNCPFANSVWVCSVLFLRTVSVYCPFVAGGLGR